MTNDTSIAAHPARRTSEARLASPVRSQAAFVRALLDEVERVAPAGGDRAVNEQLADELTRLGCRCVELANALKGLLDAQAKASQVTVRCA